MDILRNIPMHCNRTCINYIGNTIVYLLYMDRKTIKQIQLDFDRVYVKVYVEKDIAKETMIDIGERCIMSISVTIFWVHGKYSTCKQLDHNCGT